MKKETKTSKLRDLCGDGSVRDALDRAHFSDEVIQYAVDIIMRAVEPRRPRRKKKF